MVRYFLKLIFGKCRVEIFDLCLCFEVEELKNCQLIFQNEPSEITRECEATSFQAEHKWEKVVKSSTQDQNGLLKKFHQTYFFNFVSRVKPPREGQLGTL